MTSKSSSWKILHERCLYANLKLSVAERWEVKKEHCSCCLFIPNAFFSYFFNSSPMCTLSRIAERGGRRKWKEKKSFCCSQFHSHLFLFFCSVLCHSSLWKQTDLTKKNWNWIFFPPDKCNFKGDNSKQVEFPEVVKQINHFFYFNVFLSLVSLFLKASTWNGKLYPFCLSYLIG